MKHNRLTLVSPLVRHCRLGNRKVIWPVKSWSVGMFALVICLELCTSYELCQRCHLYHLPHTAAICRIMGHSGTSLARLRLSAAKMS